MFYAIVVFPEDYITKWSVSRQYSNIPRSMLSHSQRNDGQIARYSLLFSVSTGHAERVGCVCILSLGMGFRQQDRCSVYCFYSFV